MTLSTGQAFEISHFVVLIIVFKKHIVNCPLCSHPQAQPRPHSRPQCRPAPTEVAATLGWVFSFSLTSVLLVFFFQEKINIVMVSTYVSRKSFLQSGCCVPVSGQSPAGQSGPGQKARSRRLCAVPGGDAGRRGEKSIW